MSIDLKWVANSEDDIANYKVERSVVGTITSNSAPFNILTTDTLQLRIDGGELLTITFSSVTNGAATASEVASAIESVIASKGGKAKVSGSKVIIQSKQQNDRGSLRIAGGSSLSGLGLTAKKYSLESDWYLIGSPVNPELTDASGELGYKYRIRAVNTSAEESAPSISISPTERSYTDLSVIYGFLVDHNGQPLTHTEVQYGTPALKRPSDDSLQAGYNEDANVGIGSNSLLSVLTDHRGYFQMTVNASVPLRLKIDAVNFDTSVQTPAADTIVDFNDLEDALSYHSMQLGSDEEFE